MDKCFHNDFEAGTQDTYVLDAEDVGELLMIKLEHDQAGLYSDWFVERVLITCSHDSGRLYEFPCGHWVQKESVFFEGKGKLELQTFGSCRILIFCCVDFVKTGL